MDYACCAAFGSNELSRSTVACAYSCTAFVNRVSLVIFFPLTSSEVLIMLPIKGIAACNFCAPVDPGTVANAVSIWTITEATEVKSLMLVPVTCATLPEPRNGAMIGPTPTATPAMLTRMVPSFFKNVMLPPVQILSKYRGFPIVQRFLLPQG